MKKILSIICLFVLTAFLLAGCKSGDYDKGVKLQEEGKYEEAVSAFEGIDDYENYKDTSDKIKECKAMIAAIDKYDEAKISVEQKNSALDSAVSDAEKLIQKGEKALDCALPEKTDKKYTRKTE